jgi:hypothetical protein
MICLAGFRYGIGTDYWSYYNIFVNNISKNVEVGYNFLMQSYKNVFPSNSFYGFVFFIASLSIGLKCLFFQRLKQPFLALLIYFSLSYMTVDFNIIRQGWAFSVIFYAFIFARKSNFFIFCILVILAATIHISAFIYFPLYFVCSKKITIKPRITIIIFLAAICVRLFFVSYLQMILLNIVSIGIPELASLKHYITIGNVTPSEILGIMRRSIIIFIYSILQKEKEHNDCFFMLYIIGFFMYTIFSGSHMLAYRLSMLFDIFIIPLFSDIKIKYNTRNSAAMFLLLGLLFITYFSARRGDPFSSYQTHILNL